MKLQAIEEFKLEYSRDIQQYITLKTFDNTLNIINSYEEYLMKMIYQTFSNFDNNIADINEMINSNEIQIRSEIQSVYEETKKRHIKEIEDLLLSQKIELIRAETRQTNEALYLKEQSKKYAAINNIQVAQTMLNEAETISIQNQTTMKNAIFTKYTKILGQITSKQCEELRILQEKLESSLYQNETIHQEMIQDQSKKAENAIRNGLKKSIIDASTELNKKEQRSLISKRFTQFIMKILKESNNPYFVDLKF